MVSGKQVKSVQPKGRLSIKQRRGTEEVRSKDQIYRMIYENNRIF